MMTTMMIMMALMKIVAMIVMTFLKLTSCFVMLLVEGMVGMLLSSLLDRWCSSLLLRNSLLS